MKSTNRTKKYSIDEIDDMREAVRTLTAKVSFYAPPYDGLMDQERYERYCRYQISFANHVEERLRTMLMAGVDPKEMAAKAARHFKTLERERQELQKTRKFKRRLEREARALRALFKDVLGPYASAQHTLYEFERVLGGG